jgi:hypothetical protein
MTPSRSHDGLWGQWFTLDGGKIGKNLTLGLESPQPFQAVLSPGPGDGVTVYHRKTYWEEGWDNLVSREVLPDGSWAGPRNSLASLRQLAPRFVRPLPSGGYVIVLIGARQDRLEFRTFLLFTDAQGRRVRGPSVVYPARFTEQYVDGLAVSPSGKVLVTWTDSTRGGGLARILGQTFSSTGRPQGPAVQISAPTFGRKYVGRAAALADRGFVVVWDDEDPYSGAVHLRMRFLDPDGKPLGPERRVDDEDSPGRLGGNLDADAQGNFFVTWTGAAPSGSPGGRASDIWGRLFRPDGQPFGPKRVLNTYTADDQTEPYVVAGADGTFIVVWQSYGQDGDAEGIFGQVFAVPR